MRETLGTNIKRGFNRLFIVLAAVWAAYCLFVYPQQQIKEINTHYGEYVAACRTNPLEAGRAACLKGAERIYPAQTAKWSLKNFDFVHWFLLILAVIVFPLVVYGCCRGVAAVGLWVWRGFRATPVP